MRRWLTAVCIVLAAAAHAQNTTSSLDGRVTGNGMPLAGVLVTITSPALQGARSTQTSVNGTYNFTAVPPGTYRVTFAMSGLQTIVKAAELQLAELTTVDAELQAILEEEVVVTPATRIALETQQVSTNISQDFVNLLPIGRTITDIAKLSAGVQDVGPRRQVTIHGSTSADNLWLVNGAVIAEGRQNQPQNLFIEDAIQETTVLTAGISAEYGRFTGGVISVITKSGGNDLSGSLRDSVSNDEWGSVAPGSPEPLDKVNHDFEATAGGRILRDRLWFFLAGRSAERRQRKATAVTEIPFVSGTDERRWEAKLTANLGASQTLVGSYIDVDARDLNQDATSAGDLRSLYDLERPHSLLGLHYTAIFSGAATIEAQYTDKNYSLRGGSDDRSLTGGTPILGYNDPVGIWSPLFCRSCGDNYRDNREVMLKATVFLSRPRWGTHNIVAGFSDYHDLAADVTNQAPSDFTLYAGAFAQEGTQLYPILVPGESALVWSPIFVPSEGDDFGTRSFYVNDRIDIGTRWSFNAGIRFDSSSGRDQGGDDKAEDSRWSPRLSAIWDVGGNRRDRVSLSYGRYAAKVSEVIASISSPAGRPASLEWTYDGPELNTGGSPYLTSDEVLRRMFAWFESVGGTSNTDLLASTYTPFANQIEGKLKAPVMDELVLGYGRQFGASAYLRADLIRREWHDFYVNRATTETGTVEDPNVGITDRVVVGNSDAGLTRQYDGLAMQGSWKRGRITTGGNYTLSRLRGNAEPETVNVVVIDSPAEYFPEYNGFEQYAPVGYLAGDERHRANLWAAVELPTPLGRFDLSVLQTFHSGRRYSIVAPIDVRPYVTNPGYVNPPISRYYFSDRGEFRLDDIAATNVALNFSRVFGPVEAFVETDVLNVFDRQGVESVAGTNQTVRTSRSDRNLVPFNPFTATPIECPSNVATSSAQCRGIANYQLHASFGKPARPDAYQQPRTFRVSIGVRF